MAVTIPCRSDSADSIANFLFELGSSGLEEQDGCVKGYFEAKVPFESISISLERYLNNLRELGFSIGKPQFEQVPFKDWNFEYRSYFHPVQITSRIMVKPPWIERERSSDQAVIDIFPGLAFGTGTHETTQLCLMFLDKVLKPRETILDIGTGSGVLSIGAIKLGASHAVAVDVDSNALANAYENVVLNGVQSQIELRKGSIDVVFEDHFDLICVNISYPVVVKLIPELKRFVLATSRIILSGFLASERKSMESKIIKSGYRILKNREKGEWSGLLIETLYSL